MLTFTDGRLSFKDHRNAGWGGLLFEFNGSLSSAWECRERHLDERGGRVVLAGPGHVETLKFTVEAQRQMLVVSRTITNPAAPGSSPLRFRSVTDGLLDPAGAITLGVPVSAIDYFKIRYFHSSNVKVEKFPRFRVEHPYVRCLPYDPVHFNHDEANHVPAWGVCDRDGQTILVEGDLNQVRFERSWELGLLGPNKASCPGHYRAIERYTLSDGFTLPAGESVEVSRVFYQIRHTGDPGTPGNPGNPGNPGCALDDYIAELGQHHDFRGPRTRLRHEGVYCTWNYGGYANIDEANILLRARLLAEKVPACTHFLIDDGYQADRRNRNAGICSFYPDPAMGYEPTKFPRGMKVIADEIRQLGLRPCIWLSPKIYLDSRLAAEKPHWLLRDTQGSAELLGPTSFLDLSVPEARDFYLRVLDALLVQWGYEGIKYDFMTQWFLLEQIRYQHGSGLEWRDFAFREIRNRIGDDGLLMTCIAMSAGNPFPGLHADCYRCGFDIHEGTWAEQVRSCSGTLPQVTIEGRRTFLLNMDSAGFGKIPPHEQQFRFTWCFITQGIMEIGGLLENHSDAQFAMFNRLLANCDRGHKVICHDDRAMTGEPLPEVLQVRYPADSRMAQTGVASHVAVFNWSNQVHRIARPVQLLGIEPGQRLTDFWSDEEVQAGATFLSLDLPPRSARLLTQGHASTPDKAHRQ